jgi:hypothetical protein
MGANFDLFWQEQEAFRARQDDDVKRKLTLERKEKAWVTRGERYLKGTTIKTKGLIQISEAEQRRYLQVLRDKIGEVDAAAEAAFDTHLGGMALTAAREWPVLSGLSRSNITLSFSAPAPGVFSGTIRSGAPYTPYIRPSGERAQREAAKAAGVKFKAEAGRTPSWKMQFLVKVGDSWVFDASAYRTLRIAERAANPGRKHAANNPYQTFIRKPSKPALAAISADVLKVANSGKV